MVSENPEKSPKKRNKQRNHTSMDHTYGYQTFFNTSMYHIVKGKDKTDANYQVVPNTANVFNSSKK